MNGVPNRQQNAERAAQGRQRYMDYSLRALRPRYLPRKAQDYLMERPNATWNDLCTQIKGLSSDITGGSSWLC